MVSNRLECRSGISLKGEEAEFRTIEDFKLIFRFLWICFVAIAIFFCGKITYAMYNKYQTAPIRIKYENVVNGLENVPFPAITYNNELLFYYEYISLIKMAAALKKSLDDVILALGDDRYVD
jgi:hypothetical protein